MVLECRYHWKLSETQRHPTTFRFASIRTLHTALATSFLCPIGIPFQWTEYRETINPRPTQELTIAASQKAYADAGVGSYNEGAHDDVNKHVWAAVFWGCDDGDTNCTMQNVVHQWLTEYSRLHFGSDLQDTMTAGIYGLEQNWIGPILENPSINTTYALFKSVEQAMPVRLRWQWRLQQLLYRANFDKFLQVRATEQLRGEQQALETLRINTATDPIQAMNGAAAVLDSADARSEALSAHLWTEMRVWAEALFQSIHEQFSVPIYGGEYTRRGNTLDTAKLPLSNAPFLRRRFAEIHDMQNKSAQIAALTVIVNWADPGPQGFYDDLGEVGARAVHYVHRGTAPPHPQTGDQSLWPSPLVEVVSASDQYYQLPPSGSIGDVGKKSLDPPALPSDRPRSQLTYVDTQRCPMTYPLPIQLKYPALPANEAYTVSVTGLSSTTSIVLSANDIAIWNGPVNVTKDTDVWSFGIPGHITASGGDLELSFTAPTSGLRLYEVWLRMDDSLDHR
eukprot:m.709808 g.709808  ORF g.709808 m.709808 type:complete len:508 (-) comp22947_c0_seq1:982-2505(-)